LTAANSAAADTACGDCAAQIARQARRRHSDVADDELPPSSAKIRKVLELLETIKARGEGEKTIIFSQFTSWLDILDPFLRAERIRFVRRACSPRPLRAPGSCEAVVDGSMKIEERQESLTKIKESKKVNVILVSFKAGSTGAHLVLVPDPRLPLTLAARPGAGLNLTSCNFVILVDLWWNPALEVRRRSLRVGR
jgi:SNF2 family DNA or RNA helicase